MPEIIVTLTADQWAEIQTVEQAKADLDNKKSLAIRFLLLSHAPKARVDAALATGKLAIQLQPDGSHALVIPETDDASMP